MFGGFWNSMFVLFCLAFHIWCNKDRIIMLTCLISVDFLTTFKSDNISNSILKFLDLHLLCQSLCFFHLLYLFRLPSGFSICLLSQGWCRHVGVSPNPPGHLMAAGRCCQAPAELGVTQAGLLACFCWARAAGDNHVWVNDICCKMTALPQTSISCHQYTSAVQGWHFI